MPIDINFGALQQANPFAAYGQGQDMAAKRMQRQASATAGQKLASGDRAGAMADLGRVGMVDDVRTLQNDQQDADDRTALAEQKAQQERAKALLTVTKGLKGVPAGGRRQALEGAMPMFQQLGMDVTAFAQLTEDQLTDQNLDLFTGEITKHEAQWKERRNADGSTEWFDINAVQEQPQGSPAPQVAAAPAQAGGSTFDAHIGPMLQREGGFVARDGHSGVPANYGINQKANPDIDVRNLTPERAAQIYKERYWDAIGADQLPPEARGAVFDAAVNQGPQTALRLWQQSGWDVSRFNQLRLERYRGTPGYAENGKSWERRVAETGGGPARLAGGAGNDRLPAGPRTIQGSAPQAPKQPAAPAGYRYSQDGNLQYIPGGPADPAQERAKPKAPTDGDKKTTGFAYRTLQANDRMNGLADQGIFKPATATAQLFDRSKNGVVRVVTKTAQDRQFIQAAKEWLAPVLRKDTGAAVTDEELSTYMDIFIPKFEDDPQTLRQKANARHDTMTAIVREAGPLYDQTYGSRKFNVKFQGAPKKAGGPKMQGSGWKVLP